MARFTVDTHLFRELGELLVGRDSTALIELIKNSYDADATEVLVHGERLDDPAHGRIVVLDNGTGMTAERFLSGFLRIASRLKDQGTKRSGVFGRRYTGVKGIGRLAAHKLARRLEVTSVSGSKAEGATATEVRANLNWDAIEAYETLDEMPEDVISVVENDVAGEFTRGTQLILSNLRRSWTPSERARFFTEVQALQTPEFIISPLSKGIVSEPVLFERPILRDISTELPPEQDDGFEVLLEGDFAAGDEYWEVMAEMAAWVIEMRTDADLGCVHYAISPTRRTLDRNQDARSHRASIRHPDSDNGPWFDARILVREGPITGKGARTYRTWISRASGVRVYLEGFRVLPYGEDDWLALDADYAGRARQLDLLRDLPLIAEFEEADPDEGLTRLPHNNYFGGVFLTQERASTLRMLVNREGFVPEAGFDTLVRLVRTGINLCTRVRAASNLKPRSQRRMKRAAGRKEEPDKDSDEPSSTDEDDSEHHKSLPELISEAVTSLGEVQQIVGQGKAEAILPKIKGAVRALEKASGRADSVISEAALYRVLASVGTQMAAFVHEMNALLGATQALSEGLKAIYGDRTLSQRHRRQVRLAWEAAIELAQWIERQGAYLTDVVTPDARRRRSRQRLTDRFDAAVRLVKHSADRRQVEIDNRIPRELKSLPMFPVELTIVFANLLTNAVKGAQNNGRIEAVAGKEGDLLRVRVQNTGTRVDPSDGERWFQPFESTTAEVNPVLGQGMGLGLTITRSMLDHYGIKIRFVRPDAPFATAVEMTFPE